MKKTYKSPQLEIIMLNAKTSMFAASIPVGKEDEKGAGQLSIQSLTILTTQLMKISKQTTLWHKQFFFLRGWSLLGYKTHKRIFIRPQKEKIRTHQHNGRNSITRDCARCSLLVNVSFQNAVPLPMVLSYAHKKRRKRDDFLQNNTFCGLKVTKRYFKPRQSFFLTLFHTRKLKNERFSCILVWLCKKSSTFVNVKTIEQQARQWQP